MSVIWEQRVLDAVFNGVTFRIENAYVGLATYNDVASPPQYYELPHSDYSRKAIEWGPAADDGSITNTNQMIWSPTTNWGTIPYVFLSDVAQGGIMYLIASLGVNSGAGSKLIIEPGTLTVT